MMPDPVRSPRLQAGAPTLCGVLPDIGDNQPNLLPYELTQQDVRVELPAWTGSLNGREDRVDLFVGVYHVNEKTWTAPIDPADLFIMLPKEELVEGVHSLQYVLQLWNGNPDDSAITRFTVDKTPPTFGPDQGQVTLPTDLVDATITDLYLTTHSENVRVSAALHREPREGDVITWYLGQTQSETARAGSHTLQAGELGGPLTIDLAGVTLRGMPDGAYRLWTRANDRAGNPGTWSIITSVTLQTTPVPRYLPAPRLLEAVQQAGAWVLDPLAVNRGAKVELQADTTLHPGEEVRVELADESGAPTYVGEYQALPADRRFTLDKQLFAPYVGGSVLNLRYRVNGVVAKGGARVEHPSTPSRSRWRACPLRRPGW